MTHMTHMLHKQSNSLLWNLLKSEEANPDADSDFADSSDDEAKEVKHDPDKIIKNENDIKTDPENKPEKLETGQRQDETLEEFKLRLEHTHALEL